MRDAGVTGRPPAGRRLWARAGLLTVGLVTAYSLAALDLFGPHHPALGWTVLTCVLATVAVLLLRQIRDVLMNRSGTRAGLVIPLLMSLSVLVFAASYFVLARQPGEFTGLRTRLDALYFTMVTLATVGFGDITPTGQAARALTVVQIVYTFVFLTAAATTLSRQLHARLVERPPRDGDR